VLAGWFAELAATTLLLTMVFQSAYTLSKVVARYIMYRHASTLPQIYILTMQVPADSQLTDIRHAVRSLARPTCTFAHVHAPIITTKWFADSEIFRSNIMPVLVYYITGKPNIALNF